MKKETKRKIIAGILLLLLYFLLLFGLVCAEQNDPNAGIHSIADAIWYSIVTLTTVGYGDLYPVSPAGKLIATAFILCSLGLLTTLIGTVISVLTGPVRRDLFLYRHRKSAWFLFQGGNEESLALAKNLQAFDPDAVFIFLGDQKIDCAGQMDRAIRWEDSLSRITRRKENKEVNLFFMEPDGFRNYYDAKQCKDLNINMYCMSQMSLDQELSHIGFFNKYDCQGRLYWRQHPVLDPQEVIVLIGHGRYQDAILECGLQTNILSPKQRMTYHIFDHDDRFLKTHYCIRNAFAIDGVEEGKDSIFFHEGGWRSEHELLLGADRIILCDEEDENNLAVLHELKRYYPVGGEIHVRLEKEPEEEKAIVFGNLLDLFSAENVMKLQMNHLAVWMNEIYRSSCGYAAPEWKELPDFLKRSNLAAAEHLYTKIHILLPDLRQNDLTAQVCQEAFASYQQRKVTDAELFRRIEHERWERFFFLNNWEYAPKRDNALRHHPLLLPFEELSYEERVKDDYAWELIGKITL